MQQELILWEQLLKSGLEIMAIDFKDGSLILKNEYQMGDKIRDYILDHHKLEGQQMQVWPEATWFTKGKFSGFFVDRTIMSDKYAEYFPKAKLPTAKIMEYNKEFL